ncbi:MAG TPA: bifunctional diaminohydroxyphosphoribosylaminopyrimidine deaminase/5-amino-6-(5-phosphoribosylamino)uracil reductase RibD [Vicinamibacterales bacterium]|nr:bifunctional diaminohydroxyphosphoribosylaminopyrimidine deaminase/5-amino-6-(5-phosphoribosylamino)uracil reductase RibD [Vicinamibacterales bacterium]
MTDDQLMARALLVAERGRGTTSPNPIVGAVVLDSSGVIVGQGAHRVAGGPHAEVIALDEASGRARGGTLYCTLEPCCHVGRTGPCVDRILSEGVSRVVFAVPDPNPLVAGGGAKFLRARGIDVVEGIRRDEAVAQNAAFFTWMTARRPYVTLKAAISADGLMGREGQRVQLTGAAADRFFHRQRAEVDAIAVGSGTVLADDPLLTARGAYRSRPLLRVLFDWRLRIPPTARVFSTLAEGPVIMVVSAAATDNKSGELHALERLGITVERRKDRELAPVLRWLGQRDVTTLVVEGGPRLHQGFCEAGLVDRVQWIVTPGKLERGVPMAAGLDHGGLWQRGTPAKVLGPDRLVEWHVHRTD